MTVRADLVSGVLPVRPDGRMLLLQRPGTETWEPPAGRLAPGEGFEEGAVREVYEETGLLVAPQRLLATWVGGRPGGSGLLASAIYVGRVAGEEEVRISDEHLGYRWATLDEWLNLPSWWSHENIARVAGPLATLPNEPPPAEPPPPERPLPPGVVHASLGAGTVIVDLDGAEPRALLLRRRKPPVGLWENPGGMLEEGEDFVGCARRETLEETGLDAEPKVPWFARVEPWRSPDDPKLYAGVAFLARHPGGDVRVEKHAHDSHVWATEREWRELPTWYTKEDSNALWVAVREMKGDG